MSALCIIVHKRFIFRRGLISSWWKGYAICAIYIRRGLLQLARSSMEGKFEGLAIRSEQVETPAPFSYKAIKNFGLYDKNVLILW